MKLKWSVLMWHRGDMGALITKKRKLTEEVARIYIAEVTLALEALHNNLIVFR